MNDVKYRYDTDVSDLTTFGVPARAAALAEWQSEGELAAILADNSLPRPLKVIGGGSNLIFTKSFEGTIIHRIGRPKVAICGYSLVADAHARLDDLCAFAASHGFRGLENLSGIPGTLGGAIVQNAGAYGAEISDVLILVNLLDMHTGEFFGVHPDWMRYSYRNSRLKEDSDRYVVLNASIKLSPASDPAKLDYGNLRTTLGDTEATPEAVRRAVLEVRASKLPDPESVGSAGSFFRNPEVPASLLSPEMPRYELPNGLFKVPAAWLIDRAGLRGVSVGGASTWPRQPLVIVNTDGRATAADVIALERLIVNTVSERFNITLTPEVEHI